MSIDKEQNNYRFGCMLVLSRHNVDCTGLMGVGAGACRLLGASHFTTRFVRYVTHLCVLVDEACLAQSTGGDCTTARRRRWTGERRLRHGEWRFGLKGIMRLCAAAQGRGRRSLRDCGVVQRRENGRCGWSEGCGKKTRGVVAEMTVRVEELVLCAGPAFGAAGVRTRDLSRSGIVVGHRNCVTKECDSLVPQVPAAVSPRVFAIGTNLGHARRGWILSGKYPCS